MKITNIFSRKLTLTLTLLLLTIMVSSITSKKHKSKKSHKTKVSKTSSSHKKTNLKSHSRSKSKNQPTCPYDEDHTIELLKKVLDFLLLKPEDPVGVEAANFGASKSMCLGMLDSKRMAFVKPLETFHKAVCVGVKEAQWKTEWLEDTVWAKMGEMIINVGGRNRQCSTVLPLNKNPDPMLILKISNIVKSFTGKFNQMDVSKMPKFITGVVATKRFSPDFNGRTFTNINEASRS